jgi:hypothetical protein
MAGGLLTGDSLSLGFDDPEVFTMIASAPRDRGTWGDVARAHGPPCRFEFVTTPDVR